MSKSTKPTPGTPYVPSGPATGVPTQPGKNEQLSDNHYKGTVKPGTSKATSPGHVPNGPGHADCDHE